MTILTMFHPEAYFKRPNMRFREQNTTKIFQVLKDISRTSFTPNTPGMENDNGNGKQLQTNKYGNYPNVYAHVNHQYLATVTI